jgi:ubiquinone/menaquinone biosynthesis C-methylase UbiE
LNKKPTYISDKYNFQTAIGSSIIDEVPLWSAPFGLDLLSQIIYRNNLKVLDIGFGTGFPLVEIAQRLGKTSKVYGIDPWAPSHTRTQQKIDFYGYKNIRLIKGEAENIPLKNNSIDLIVSNNGVNNVADIRKVFSECRRISKPGAQFIISVNLNKSLFEFYELYKKVLFDYKLYNEIKRVNKHIYEKRKPVAYIKNLFTENDFEIIRVIRKKFNMRFKDGTTFFNHSLVKIGFLPNWEKLLNEKDRRKVFKDIEMRLNKISEKNGNIEMTIPYMVINSKRK